MNPFYVLNSSLLQPKHPFKADLLLPLLLVNHSFFTKIVSQGTEIDYFAQYMVTKRFTGLVRATSIGIGAVWYQFQDSMHLKMNWVLMRTSGELPGLKCKVTICSDIVSLPQSVFSFQIFNKSCYVFYTRQVQHSVEKNMLL